MALALIGDGCCTGPHSLLDYSPPAPTVKLRSAARTPTSSTGHLSRPARHSPLQSARRQNGGWARSAPGDLSREPYQPRAVLRWFRQPRPRPPGCHPAAEWRHQPRRSASVRTELVRNVRAQSSGTCTAHAQGSGGEDRAHPSGSGAAAFDGSSTSALHLTIQTCAIIATGAFAHGAELLAEPLSEPELRSEPA